MSARPEGGAPTRERKLMLRLRLLALAVFGLLIAPPATADQSRASFGGTMTLSPGDKPFNNKDVEVENFADSDGDIVVKPNKLTNPNRTNSKVTFERGAIGTVTGLDPGDTVTLRASSQATISGTGGTVDIGGATGISGSVTNTGAGSGVIRVEFNANVVVNVPSGSSINFGT